LLLSQAVAGFLLDRDGEADDDLSPKTINLYRDCLRIFTRYLGDPELSKISNDDPARFMNYLEKEYKPTKRGVVKLSGYYRDNFWKAIRSFFHWANVELNNQRPDDKLPRPKFAEDEIQPFTVDDLKKILAACEFTTEAKTEGRKSFRMRRTTAVRDRAIVLLLLETGIRLGELARLKIEDVNLEAGEIHVHPYRTGKKSRPRTIPFEKSCRKALWHYKTTHLADALGDEQFFPIAPHTIQSLFGRIEIRSGVIGVHAHRFRHTFATQYLRNGGDIFTLQRILGHSSLEMCRRYLAISHSDIKDAHRRASPVDRWHL
jgi:integrase